MLLVPTVATNIIDRLRHLICYVQIELPLLLQHIDSHTDVSYQVCAEAAQGVVSTRDFVNLRHWDVVDDVYVSSGVSIKHPAMPEQPKRVR